MCRVNIHPLHELGTFSRSRPTFPQGQFFWDTCQWWVGSEAARVQSGQSNRCESCYYILAAMRKPEVLTHIYTSPHSPVLHSGKQKSMVVVQGYSPVRQKHFSRAWESLEGPTTDLQIAPVICTNVTSWRCKSPCTPGLTSLPNYCS